MSENSSLWVILGASNDCLSLENFVVPRCRIILDCLLDIFCIALCRLWVLLKFSGKKFFFFNASSESSWVRPQAPCHLLWAEVSISVQLSRSLLCGHGSAPSGAQQGAQDGTSFVHRIRKPLLQLFPLQTFSCSLQPTGTPFLLLPSRRMAFFPELQLLLPLLS